MAGNRPPSRLPRSRNKRGFRASFASRAGSSPGNRSASSCSRSASCLVALPLGDMRGPVLCQPLVGVMVAHLVTDYPAKYAGKQPAAGQKKDEADEKEPEGAVEVEDVDRDETEEERHAESEAEVGERVDDNAFPLLFEAVHFGDLVRNRGDRWPPGHGLATMIA